MKPYLNNKGIGMAAIPKNGLRTDSNTVTGGLVMV